MRLSIAAPLLAATLAGCSSAGLSASPATQPGFATDGAGLRAAHKTLHNVYWTLFASCSYPQIQYAPVPLKSDTIASNYFCSQGNGLNYSSGLRIDKSGRLWVICFGPDAGDPGEVEVYKLPLTSAAVPLYEILLSGTNDPDHLIFDKSGNLWVTSYKEGVTEYKGPFNKSGTLKPEKTITAGLDEPSGIAMDKNGNLYVSNFAGGTSKSIAVFKAPLSNKLSYYLEGLTNAGGLIFDKSGNLYASSNGTSDDSIVRYDSNDLGSGKMPSIVDSTGASTYENDFAWSATGDLYFANCGSTGSIYVYPTSTKKFSSTLAPTVDYTDADLTQAGCAWGIAIK
ncbi:MAG TPA: hypothetical protein VGX91_03685 [Candidatus Cybelea sp.]|jgi:sugar lactone lactonase YvrE|nr:hypothetical protein [Candidatus Cybelea sp.]